MSRRPSHATRRGGPYDAKYQKLRELLISRHPFCTDCGRRDRLELDHVVPLFLTGGARVLHPAAFEVVCHPCNIKRRDAALAAAGRTIRQGPPPRAGGVLAVRPRPDAGVLARPTD